MARSALLAPLLAAALAGGCLAYNEECSRYMSDPEGTTGYLDGDVRIAKAYVRTADNAIGQLVAEAYYSAFDDKSERLRPDLAVVNGGSIRSDGVCQVREVLPKGAMKRKVLRDVLPFDNSVLVVSLTHHQLKNVLEHAVGYYSLTEPKGSFLQIYGLEFTADCSRPAEQLDASGKRKSEGQRITHIAVRRRDGSTLPIPVETPSDTEVVRVALDSFLAGGGDGFNDFKSLDPNASDRASAGSFGFEVVARYFAKAYPESKPLPAAPQARVTLISCP